jgi:hypothetical protein
VEVVVASTQPTGCTNLEPTGGYSCSCVMDEYKSRGGGG